MKTMTKCRKQLNHIDPLQHENMMEWNAFPPSQNNARIIDVAIDSHQKYLAVMHENGLLNVYYGDVPSAEPVMSVSLELGWEKSVHRGKLTWSASSKRVAFVKSSNGAKSLSAAVGGMESIESTPESQLFVCDLGLRKVIRSNLMAIDIDKLWFVADLDDHLLGISLASKTFIRIHVGTIRNEFDTDTTENGSILWTINHPAIAAVDSYSPCLWLSCSMSHDVLLIIAQGPSALMLQSFKVPDLPWHRAVEHQHNFECVQFTTIENDSPPSDTEFRSEVSIDKTRLMLLSSSHSRPSERILRVFSVENHDLLWNVKYESTSGIGRIKAMLYVCGSGSESIQTERDSVEILESCEETTEFVLQRMTQRDHTPTERKVLPPLGRALHVILVPDSELGFKLWIVDDKHLLFGLAQYRISVFAGPMYPAGYRILQAATDYFEAEDELDIKAPTCVPVATAIAPTTLSQTEGLQQVVNIVDLHGRLHRQSRLGRDSVYNVSLLPQDISPGRLKTITNDWRTKRFRTTGTSLSESSIIVEENDAPNFPSNADFHQSKRSRIDDADSISNENRDDQNDSVADSEQCFLRMITGQEPSLAAPTPVPSPMKNNSSVGSSSGQTSEVKKLWYHSAFECIVNTKTEMIANAQKLAERSFRRRQLKAQKLATATATDPSAADIVVKSEAQGSAIDSNDVPDPANDRAIAEATEVIPLKVDEQSERVEDKNTVVISMDVETTSTQL